MSLLGELWRDVIDWRELLTPKFWEYKRAMRILRNAKDEVWRLKQIIRDAQIIGDAERALTDATWKVQDDYYGLGYTYGFEEAKPWPFFWQKAV